MSLQGVDEMMPLCLVTFGKSDCICVRPKGHEGSHATVPERPRAAPSPALAGAQATVERLFPIQGGPAIPWSAIAPHEAQAMQNHGRQDLATLARRGGLSPCEAVAVLEDRPWHRMDAADALARLAVLAQPSRLSDDDRREAFMALVNAAEAESLRVMAHVEGSCAPQDAAKQAINYMREVLRAALLAQRPTGQEDRRK
jgi:hypothetical protein